MIFGALADLPTLGKVVQPYLNANRRVILAHNGPAWLDASGRARHKDMGATIAVTAWDKMLKLDAVDVPKIQAFVDKYEGIDHHGAGG